MRHPPRRRYRAQRELFALLNIGGAIFIASLLYNTADLNRSPSRDGCRIDLRQQTKFHPSKNRSPEKSLGPEIALLISFPNSGTSFTLRHVRSVTRFGTATNYAKETKEVKVENYTGVIPTIQSGDCIDCPLPMPHDSDSPLPEDFVLVKTHCLGFTSQNWNETGILTSKEAFLQGCVTPYLSVPSNNTAGRIKQIKSCPYAPSLVKRVVHIMRNPLDNIVSRFHLYQSNLFDAQKFGLSDLNVTADDALPRSAEGFRKYCSFKDRELANSRDSAIFREFHSLVPCLSEFFLYIQWHNNAFHATSEGVPTHFFYYEDFETNFTETSSSLLKFLHLKRSERGNVSPFQSGKSYNEYYTLDEKREITRLIDRFASKKTKEMLRLRYDLEQGQRKI